MDSKPYSAPVIAIVGGSNSGKTTVAASLIREFTARGLRVAAVKHCPHGHESPPGGADSERLSAAGAAVSIAASPDRLTSVERRNAEKPLGEILHQLGDGFDLVVVEGYKATAIPKILVQSDEVLPVTPSNVVAVVGGDTDGRDVPRFAPDHVERLATWIEEYLDLRERDHDVIRLIVDGSHIPLNRFPSDALSGAILGFIQSLHGVSPSPRSVEVTISSRQLEVSEDALASSETDGLLGDVLGPAFDPSPANLVSD